MQPGTVRTRRGGVGVALTFAFVLMCSLFAAPAAADQAQTVEAQARTHYQRAIDLYGDGAYDAALAELNRAWELRPSFKLLYNIAQVHTAMNDYAAALLSYRRYLAEGAGAIPPARRAEVEARIEAFEQRVATVHIDTELPGVEVVIDEVVVGRTPDVRSVVVNAGTRVLSLRHLDHAVQTRRLTVLGGTSQRVPFPGEAIEGTIGESRTTPSSAPTTVSAGPAGGEPRRTQPIDSGSAPGGIRPWMAWTATGVLAAAAVGTGLAALGSSKSLEDEKQRLNPSKNDLERRAKRTDALALTCDVLWVATVLAAGTSTWLTFRDGEAKPKLASLGVQLAPTGLRVVGRF